jgi:hypothetical protein
VKQPSEWKDEAQLLPDVARTKIQRCDEPHTGRIPLSLTVTFRVLLRIILFISFVTRLLQRSQEFLAKFRAPALSSALSPRSSRIVEICFGL